MDCKRFEGLLVDFVESELDNTEIEAVKTHLLACSSCAREVEEYKEIQRMMVVESIPQFSSEVKARLAKAAREGLAKDRTPFWKRWFYSPILVPVFSSALAFFLWVSYGQNSIDLLSTDKDIYSTEVMAKKIPAAEQPSSQALGESTFENVDSQRGRTFSKKTSPIVPKASVLKSEAQVAPLPAAPSESEESSIKRMIEADKTSDFKAQALEGSLKSRELNEPLQKNSPIQDFVNDEMSKVSAEKEQRVEKNRGDEGMLLYTNRNVDYQSRLDLALRQQREGNCDASIKTNQELLKTNPYPPKNIAEKAYLSLAQCYEQKGELDLAILNYRNVQEAAFDQAHLAKEKIESLERKTGLLKAKELEAGEVEESQKTE
ncbi:MAG: zf-HC2 domain-containing protein, partial [Thermodesulfobacteriota bacterium]